MRWIIFAAIFVLGLGYMLPAPLLVDEEPHYHQIRDLINQSGVRNPDITTPLLYHLIIGELARLLHVSSPAAVRILSGIFGALAIAAFAYASKSEAKTAQFALFPLLFPFFFLIYTDVLSLLLVLCATFLAMRGRFAVAAIPAILSVAVRQNNIMWLLFLFLWWYAAEHKDLRVPSLLSFCRKAWLYLAGFLLFAVFVVYNGGVAMGDRNMHPSFSFHLNNIYFFLFSLALLFLPYLCYRSRDIIDLLKKKWAIAAIVAAGVLFLFTFVNNHPYNIDWTEYFVRNWLLVFFAKGILTKLLFFAGIVLGALLLVVMRMNPKKKLLLALCTFLYLAPSWLVEQRYYIIPVSLLILFSEEKKWLAYLSAAIYLALDVVLLIGFKNRMFFL